MAQSLPAEIAEVMTVHNVLWESNQGIDGYGQQSYADPVEIDCWMEPAGLGGGLEANRAPLGGNSDQTDVEPQLELYFNGDDPRVRSFTLDDRFTPGGIGATGQKLKPKRISPLYGPPFDNKNPWLVVVGLTLSLLLGLL